MKQCVVKVQSQHHLDVIIGRVRSLGGKYDYWWDEFNVYTLYNNWSNFCYIWLYIDAKGNFTAQLHNHTCNCKVFETVQDAVEYLGFNTK